MTNRKKKISRPNLKINQNSNNKKRKKLPESVNVVDPVHQQHGHRLFNHSKATNNFFLRWWLIHELIDERWTYMNIYKIAILSIYFEAIVTTERNTMILSFSFIMIIGWKKEMAKTNREKKINYHYHHH